MESYLYGALEDDQPRLIQLLPGDYEVPLQCDLQVCSFKTAPRYEALS